MTTFIRFGLISAAACFGALAIYGHCHHGDHYDCDGYQDNCQRYDDDCYHHDTGAYNSNQGSAARGAAAVSPARQTLDGTVDEIIYLPGSSPSRAMVELRVQAGERSERVRMAPAGFLKQSGLRLKEGDKITLAGFPVDGFDGAVFVASEVRVGARKVSLRDQRGRPLW